jgi:hypothetical protein
MPTNDTSGPLFTTSSPSAALQSSLENRLRARLAGNGSPEYALTWRPQDMPSGPPICALRAAARRISDSDCSGWPTPTGEAGKDESAEAWLSRKARQYEIAPGKGIGSGSLHVIAQAAGWATPTKTDAERRGELSLTPKDPTLNHMAGWATPASRDYRHPNATSYAERGGGAKGEQLPNQVNQAVSGLLPNGSPVSTAKRGVLNPAFSLWLMGYPAEWESCAPPATRSSRRSPPSS